MSPHLVDDAPGGLRIGADVGIDHLVEGHAVGSQAFPPHRGEGPAHPADVALLGVLPDDGVVRCDVDHLRLGGLRQYALGGSRVLALHAGIQQSVVEGARLHGARLEDRSGLGEAPLGAKPLQQRHLLCALRCGQQAPEKVWPLMAQSRRCHQEAGISVGEDVYLLEVPLVEAERVLVRAAGRQEEQAGRLLGRERPLEFEPPAETSAGDEEAMPDGWRFHLADRNPRTRHWRAASCERLRRRARRWSSAPDLEQDWIPSSGGSRGPTSLKGPQTSRAH
mmetsp:Transcript_60517/g.176927  ORF Transcript_60517/g.176927 Transcript_60517/m.176927 type:complete len:279 (-) Transcript_60517:74-910(-)